MEKNPLHIKQPDLHTSPEVQRAAERKARRTGKRVPNNPNERIGAYADRLENIFLNPDERTRARNLELFRDQIYDKLIIKRENFPESYFELQQRIARERGQPIEAIAPDVRKQMIDTAIEDQRASLDAWIDYLASDDAMYPAWFKYYVWTQITKLSQFDKERGEFKRRTATTVAPYPDIYREPLAQIADLYERVKDNNKDAEARREFDKKFPNLYAELIAKSLAAQMERSEDIRGRWVKYVQGESGAAEKLFESLEGKGTGWCTAGRSTAEAQIESGDFYVYYTNDAQGNPTQPRLAIRMEGTDRIGEVRGILPHQNIEPMMQSVLDAKLSEFGAEADAYRKKSNDMRLLTALAHKHEQGQQFSADDLTFLYEINAPIEGFGYDKDPRIEELRSTRNVEDDMLVVFQCTKQEIAHVPGEITPETKAYVGPLEPGIFERLPENIGHIYTKFPERKIQREEVTIGGANTEELIHMMESAQVNISEYAGDMLKSSDFVTSTNQETIPLVRLAVADLGFTRNPTTHQLFERVQALGLELCPAETGPHYRLQNLSQPMGDWVYIGMQPITGQDGRPRVFRVAHRGGRSVARRLLGATWQRVASRRSVCLPSPQVTLNLVTFEGAL